MIEKPRNDRLIVEPVSTGMVGLLMVLLLPVLSFAEPVGFYESIKPLLAVHCHKCHGEEKQKRGLRLDSLKAALAGGESGAVALVPGQSAKSEILKRITSSEPDEQMPPKGPRLSAGEVALIRRWIDEGARWPERDDYWAFRPPAEPPQSAAESASNPIDRFISAKLAGAKITPRPPADARTLLRRAYADLIGMPPSPAEATQFLNDSTPGAFEKLLDRLLADARYGERWARHWLDIVRYGESDGYEDDRFGPMHGATATTSFRSFNADKPYDRFVQEQVAGDELWPDDPEAWVATGFARLGAWDGMSKEPAQQRQDFLNDATDAVGAAFLGVTLGCARCHDHKYDDITQQDYYRMQAFFAGVKRESPEMKVAIPQPEFVTGAFKTGNAELTRLRGERDALLREAREALEKASGDGKGKVTGVDVKKKAESLHPGRAGELDAKIKAAENRVRFQSPNAEAVFRGGEAPATRVLKGGELSRPGEEVPPGFIAALIPGGVSTVSDEKPKGRTVLARWLTSPQHPLTSRVIVNRLWQHHFGTGLVATPSDFGHNGRRPTHPELLDWLALQFVRDGWSLKKMHRLIMTSAAWRRESSPDSAASAADPENNLLWRMNRRRLEGEAIRDALLAVSGSLNSTMGGPGVYAPLPKGVTVELPNNDKELSWGTSTESDARRRSIYLFQRRSLTFPLVDVFDGAPMNQACAARPQTTVAPQALALFNGEFCRECAAHFAERLRREAGDDPAKQIEHAFLVAFARKPADIERKAALHFLSEQTARRSGDHHAALTDCCHAILNSNELLYPD